MVNEKELEQWREQHAIPEPAYIQEKRAEQERKRAEQERKRAEQERKLAEQRIEQKRKRAEQRITNSLNAKVARRIKKLDNFEPRLEYYDFISHVIRSEYVVTQDSPEEELRRKAQHVYDRIDVRAALMRMYEPQISWQRDTLFMQCPICLDETRRLGRDLITHFIDDHPNVSPSDNSLSMAVRAWTCSECSEVVAFDDRKRHLHLVHPHTCDRHNNVGYDMECSTCGKRFHGNTRCSICGKWCRGVIGLRDHTQLKHST